MQEYSVNTRKFLSQFGILVILINIQNPPNALKARMPGTQRALAGTCLIRCWLFSISTRNNLQYLQRASASNHGSRHRQPDKSRLANQL